MTRCADSHPRDETCGDCAPPTRREDRLDHVRRLRDELAAIPGAPHLDDPADDSDTDDLEHPEGTATP